MRAGACKPLGLENTIDFLGLPEARARAGLAISDAISTTVQLKPPRLLQAYGGHSRRRAILRTRSHFGDLRLSPQGSRLGLGYFARDCTLQHGDMRMANLKYQA